MITVIRTVRSSYARHLFLGPTYFPQNFRLTKPVYPALINAARHNAHLSKPETTKPNLTPKQLQENEKKPYPIDSRLNFYPKDDRTTHHHVEPHRFIPKRRRPHRLATDRIFERQAFEASKPVDSVPEQRPVTVPAKESSAALTDFEIAFSKILPAGFFWQLFSTMAENNGIHASSLGFYALTGLGDAIGVGGGHMLFQFIKQLLAKTVNAHTKSHWEIPVLNQELRTSAWLSSAAFASGGMWQPAVNSLTTMSNNTLLIAPLTGVACGGVFFGGLRIGRRVFKLDATDDNLKDDAILSAKVGGGTGMFVTTVVGLLNNPFEVLGITDSMTLLESCTVAGSSTFLGFLAVSGLFNAGKRAMAITSSSSASHDSGNERSKPKDPPPPNITTGNF